MPSVAADPCISFPPFIGDPEVHDNPTAGHHAGLPGRPANAPTADVPSEPGPRPKWSIWWIFPALLAAYITYSSIRYLPFGKHKAAMADDFLTQSLAGAQAGDYPDCITAARQAIQLKPPRKPTTNIGWCSAQMGNCDEGIRNTTGAVKLQPDLERARNNLLWMILQRDGRAPVSNTAPASAADAALLAHRYPECIDAARQAVRLNPRSAGAYDNLRYCSGNLGEESAMRACNI